MAWRRAGKTRASVETAAIHRADRKPRWQPAIAAARKIPCYTPVGDQQCALLGVGLRRGELSLNIATGSQASQRVDSCVPGSFQVRPYFQGDFLRTITHLPAGRALNALLRLFSELGGETEPEELWRRALAKMAAVSATTARLDLAFFPSAFGFGGRDEPFAGGQPDMPGICCWRPWRTWRPIMVAQRSCSIPRGAWKSVVLSGGIAQKIPRLRELIAREIPVTQRLAVSPDDTLQGLLILASLWSGRHGDLDAIQARVVEARPAAASKNP